MTPPAKSFKRPLKIVFTDASLRLHLGHKTIKPYGTGYLILHEDESVVTGYKCHITTDLKKYTKSNTQRETLNTTLTELMGMLDAVNTPEIKRLDEVILYSDSEVGMKAYYGILNHQAKYEKLVTEIKRIVKHKKLKLAVRWVPGHKQIWGNTHSDKLANSASHISAVHMGVLKGDTTQLCIKRVI